MPIVKRRVPCRSYTPLMEDVKVPVSKLRISDFKRNPFETSLIVATRVALATSTALFFWGISGSPGEEMTHDQVRAGLAKDAREAYFSGTQRQKFEMAYVTPQRETMEGIEGQTGLKGKLRTVLHPAFYATFGQYCLQGSAYDTTPSTIRGRANGDISAVASLVMSGTSVTVHPAGSNAPALVFNETSGELVPDSATEETLIANGCKPRGLVVSSDYRLKSPDFKVIALSNN